MTTRPATLMESFIAWGRWRIVACAILSSLAALMESVSILLLIPLIGILLAETSPESTPIGGMLSYFGTSEQLPSFGTFLMLFAIMLVLRGIAGIGRDALSARIGQGFLVVLRMQLLTAVTRVDWPELALMQHGRIGHSIGRDIERVSESVHGLMNGLTAGILLISQICLCLWIAPGATVLALAAGGLVVAALAPLRARSRALSRRLGETDYIFFSSLLGFIERFKPSKAHGLEDDFIARIGAQAQEYARASTRVGMLYSTAAQLTQMGVGLAALIVLAVGHYGLGTSVDRLIVLTIILARLATPIQTLQSSLQSLRVGEAAYSAAMQQTVHTAELPQQVAAGIVAPWPTAPELATQSITLRGADNNRKILLEDVSVTVPAGQRTAIFGPSGSGKTLLCDVLCGLQRPESGTVLIDGVPLDAVNRRRMQQILAYIGQEGLNFAGTVRANLTWGCGDVDDAAIWQALETVEAAGLIRDTADGLDTEIRMAGTRFSGGERQRLGLARAILRQPTLVVLDEATNALDPMSEDRILARLFDRLGNATILMVSHRSATGTLADHVIRIENGRSILAG